MPIIDAQELISLAGRILEGAGAPREAARRVAESLVESNLLGHDSHGVIRLPGYVEMMRDGRVQAGAQPRVVRETASTAVVDGGWQFGQVAARFAMETAIRKAAGGGVAAVQLYNSGHIGRLGEYAEQALPHRMIGLVTTNNHGGGQALSPFGGVARRLSPSPIAIAVPGGKAFPIVLDRKSTRLNSSHIQKSRMPSSA